MNYLDQLQQFINQSNSSNSNTHKLDTIKIFSDNEDIKRGFVYTYDPYKQYYVTSKTCIKRNDLVSSLDTTSRNLYDILDMLNDREVTGHDAIKLVNAFVRDHKEHEDLIWKIIDGNLKTRSTVSMINKIIPGLIPTFDVALASKYEPKNCDFENERWFASRKLDGVRCIIRKEGNKINAFSRAGKEFTTLQNVLDDVAKMPGNFVLDGEICIMDESGNEDFQGIMKEIKRKDHTIRNPKYIVFDYLTLEEFDSKKGEQSLSNRISNAIDNCWGVDNTLSVLEQEKVKDVEHLSELISDADKNGYEGIMLRKDCGYQGKRTKNLLKCKQFHDAEYKVIDLDFDTNRVIVDGKEVEEMMLRNVIIEHKGNKVSVGSGFSHEEKRYYYENPSKLLNKTITVQYFEESINQSGEHSLRFPTVKMIYENGREC
jgi:DNA ligase-1